MILCVSTQCSIKAEFVAACDAGKMILYLCSLLQELNINQHEATVLYAKTIEVPIMMAKAQQPTQCTQHVNIKHFSLLQWVKKDLMILTDISTNDNCADTLTKPLLG